jgi:restriction system protein
MASGQISGGAEPAAWLVRGGELGEREERALTKEMVIAGWEELGSIEHCKTREQIRFELRQAYPNVSEKVIGNWTGQLWRFKEQIQVGDLVVMPLKTRPGEVAIGRITGPYRFEAAEAEGFRQVRSAEWLRNDIQRDAFRPDLRASITSLLTVCGLTRNEAARRIAHLAYQGTDPGVEGGEEVTSSDELLTDAAAQALKTPRRLTVRHLLAHWGESRRTGGAIARIKSDLADAGLTTRPPFTEGSVEDEVDLVSAADETGPLFELAEDTEDVSAQVPSTLRIGSLPPAKLVAVSPEVSLTYAKTLMLRRKFSQLAVIDAAGVCHGAVSWESIGKAHIASADPELADAISPAVIVDHDAHLLDQIDVIYNQDFVFVRNADRSTVTGIVTAADLTRQFGEFSRPFVLIEEAEGRLRRRAGEVYGLDELRDAVQPGRRNRVHRVTDLTFGDYNFLLGQESRWSKLGWNVDRVMFLSLLEEVRKTRNELMHFTPDPLASEQYAALDGLLELLRTVDPRL